MGFRIKWFGFTAAGLVFRVTLPGCRVQGSDIRDHTFWVCGFGCVVLGVWCTAQDREVRVQGSGFRFQVSGFRVQGSGSRFRVQGSGFRVQGLGFRVQGSGCRVHGVGCEA